MKHTKAFALLSFLAMGLSLASCGESLVSKEEMAYARELVLAMKKGEDAYNGLAFKTSFKQQYQVAYADDNENATTDYSYDYAADGSVTMAYRLDANATFDFAKVFDEGGAYLIGDQKEIAKLTSSTSSKGEFTKPDKTFHEDYSFHHIFGIQFDQRDFYAQGTHDLTDRIDPANEGAGSFQGHILRSSMESVASSAIKNSIDRILYMNAWTEVTSFRAAMDGYFAGLDISSDKAASDFVRHHNLAFALKNDVLHAEFSFDAGEVFSAIGGKKAEIDASIAGKVDIDASNAFVTGYSFDFKDAYAAMLNKELANKKTYTQHVEEFTLQGELLDYRYEDLHLNGNFIDYEADQVGEFVEGYTAHVIPDISGASH